jgi:hypothetical protein
MQPLTLDDCALKSFPCRADKTPACTHGFDDATADPQVMDRLWSDVWPCNRPALVGVATGAINGIDVLDIDGKSGGAKWYFQNLHRIPPTRTQQSRCGLHLVFQHAAGLTCSRDLISDGVDVRADGGYAVWWPASEGRSHGNAGHVLRDGPIAEWPAWLLEKASTRPAPYTGVDVPLVLSSSCRPWVPHSLYSKMLWMCHPRLNGHYMRRLRGILAMSVNRSRKRNEGLFNASLAMRDLIELKLIDEWTAVELLLETARLNGYTLKYGKARGVRRALKTIYSGLSYPRGDVSLGLGEDVALVRGADATRETSPR